MKKLFCLLLTMVMAITMLVGCGKQNSNTEKKDNESKKEKVTVALWGTQLLENYTQYLCDTFPEVEFEFVLATNSTDYYRYRNDHDDLPDILTVRRFSLKDAVLIKDLLYDLCDTELASTFYGTYLDNYTYDDGTINWLPACADVDSIIINETLFEENNIPIPTDYDSFIAACEAFEALGIQGFAYLINNDVGKPVIAHLTGEQLFNLVSNTLSLKGNRGAVCNDSTLYVSSGFEMDVSRTDSGYRLNALTVGGKKLDPNAEFSVLLCSDYDWYVVDAMKAVGCDNYKIDDVHFEEYVFKRLIEKDGQLEEPTDYITLR